MDCSYFSTMNEQLLEKRIKYLFVMFKKSKHEGSRYPCPQCEHAATTTGNLKLHVESKHEGVRYPCP